MSNNDETNDAKQNMKRRQKWKWKQKWQKYKYSRKMKMMKKIATMITNATKEYHTSEEDVIRDNETKGILKSIH